MRSESNSSYNESSTPNRAWYKLVIAVASAVHLMLLIVLLRFLAPSNGIDSRVIFVVIQLVICSTLESSLQSSIVSIKKVCDPTAIRMSYAASLVLLVTILGSIIQWSRNPFPANDVYWLGAGCVVAWIGIAIRAMAIHCLGQNFVSDICLVRTTTICRTSIYSVMRHPGEYGCLMILLGLGMQLEMQPATVIGSAVLLAVSIWRVRRENAFLKAAESHFRHSD